MDKPLVSVITATLPARSHWLLSVMEMISRQTYPNVEHIVLPEEHENLFSKRNRGIEMAKGELIIIADDDDFFSNNWIEKSVEHLLTTNADMTGLSNYFYYDPVKQEAFKFIYSVDSRIYFPTPDNRPWCADGTLCFRKSYWERNKYQTLWNHGADNYFIWACDNVKPHANIGSFIARLHDRQTEKSRDGQWQPLSVESMKEQVSKDILRYL